MNNKTYRILFLCTGNSARSIMAESIVNFRGRGKFKGYSAGSAPAGQVNPLALELLENLHLPTEGLRSKSWEEFDSPSAPAMDFIFTVCDKAAAETCPVWPGHPVTAHWGIPDPAGVEGDHAKRMQAFRDAFHSLDNRIDRFINLPIDDLDAVTLQQRLGEIGRG